jgi:predicted DNA-binding protein
MEVHLTPELEAKLDKLAAESGRPKDDLVKDAMTAYLVELNQVRETLDRRYDEIKSGTIKPVSGEEAFERLRKKSKGRRSGHE